jgi:hypothetical protein
MTLIKHSSEVWQYGRDGGCVILLNTLSFYNKGSSVKVGGQYNISSHRYLIGCIPKKPFCHGYSALDEEL